MESIRDKYFWATKVEGTVCVQNFDYRAFACIIKILYIFTRIWKIKYAADCAIIKIVMRSMTNTLYTYFLFFLFLIRERWKATKENPCVRTKGIGFVGSVLNKWLRSYRRGKTALGWKRRLGSPITAIVAAFSRFSPLSVRELSNEQSLQATKHSRRKCWEHNHLKLLHFHLALRLPRRNTWRLREKSCIKR